MTETPGRIRWEDNERRWDDGGSILGRAGTREDWLFQITQANNDPDDEALALMLQLPGADHRASEITQGGSPEALKAKAEEWLEEFVSSLGAVFGDAVAADLRSRADEMETYIEGGDEGRHDRSMFATGMRRSADLIEHGDIPGTTAATAAREKE